MKRAAFFLLMVIVSLTLQTTLLTFAPIQRVRPDLLLILTIYFGVLHVHGLRRSSRFLHGHSPGPLLWECLRSLCFHPVAHFLDDSTLQT